MAAQSRKRRGRRTQAVLAERWRESGLFPDCYAVGAGEAGSDILRTPGFAVEVKAQGDRMSLPAALRQARAGGAGVPVVVWRHNGQGEGAVGEWTVTLSLSDFEAIVAEVEHGAGYRPVRLSDDQEA